jgi:hypothetical protein
MAHVYLLATCFHVLSILCDSLPPPSPTQPPTPNHTHTHTSHLFYSFATRRYADWLQQTVRLGKNDRHASFDFTIGPIPRFKNPFGPHPDPADACVGWRATGKCSPDGPRKPADDLNCTAEVPVLASGYCECADGRNVSEDGCLHLPFTCQVRTPIRPSVAQHHTALLMIIVVRLEQLSCGHSIATRTDADILAGTSSALGF